MPSRHLSAVACGSRGGYWLIRLSESFPSSLGAWLFEAHPLLFLAAGVLVFALFWRWRQHRDKRLAIVVLILGALTIIWMTIGWLVVTPRERLVAETQKLLSVAAEHNMAAVSQLLSPRVDMAGWGKAQILTQLRMRLSQLRVSDNILRSMHVRLNGRQAQTDIVVISQTAAYGPVITKWLLIWRDHPRPGNWQITRMDLQKVGSVAVTPGAGLPSLY